MRRLIPLLLLVGLAVALFAPSALAEEDAPAEEEKTVVTSDVEPAVVQDLFIEPEPEVPAWTYRFMIPALIVLALAAVIGSVVQYFLKVVRTRYQPVE